MLKINVPSENGLCGQVNSPPTTLATFCDSGEAREHVGQTGLAEETEPRVPSKNSFQGGKLLFVSRVVQSGGRAQIKECCFRSGPGFGSSIIAVLAKIIDGFWPTKKEELLRKGWRKPEGGQEGSWTPRDTAPRAVQDLVISLPLPPLLQGHCLILALIFMHNRLL